MVKEKKHSLNQAWVELERKEKHKLSDETQRNYETVSCFYSMGSVQTFIRMYTLPTHIQTSLPEQQYDNTAREGGK